MSDSQTLEAVDRFYSIDNEIQENMKLLGKHAPGTLDAYIALRQWNYRNPPDAALTQREKELVILGIECGLRKSNPSPEFHARSAVAAGASLKDIAEVVSLAIMIAGMLTYQESGQYVLAEAARLLPDEAATGE